MTQSYRSKPRNKTNGVLGATKKFILTSRHNGDLPQVDEARCAHRRSRLVSVVRCCGRKRSKARCEMLIRMLMIVGIIIIGLEEV